MSRKLVCCRRDGSIIAVWPLETHTRFPKQCAFDHLAADKAKLAYGDDLHFALADKRMYQYRNGAAYHARTLP